ncbi:CCHC-type zinc finger nucleic acid binding protein-like [Macrobrachium nipponense]|uniref:CCHC-type zinc finger nucleic acid binding protein-like n=1 Tax=Macrobrachium nipponense TaxID=159736 RepID=UPI0030C7AA5D
MGKTQDKDKPEEKNKKGTEKKKKTKGKKVGKGDRQDETRTEYIGERAESDLHSGEWKQVGRKKGKKSVVKSMDMSMEVDLLYSEERKKGQNGSSKSKSESEQKCGQVGHIASECQGTRMNVVCGNCGRNGHYARMCKEQHAKCVECGLEGHLVRARWREADSPASGDRFQPVHKDNSNGKHRGF